MSTEIFANRLKELMQLDSLSKNALSTKACVDRRSIRLWLGAKNFPRYDKLIKLATTFNVSADYLVGRSEILYVKIKDDINIDKIPKRVSKIIADFKKDNNLTYYALAKSLKMDQKVVKRWIESCKMPEVGTLIKLADLMKLSLDYLLGIEE